MTGSAGRALGCSQGLGVRVSQEHKGKIYGGGLCSVPGLSEGDRARWEEGAGQRSGDLMSPQGDGGACSLRR